MKKDKKTNNSYKNIIPCIKYFFPLAWEHKKSFFIVFFLREVVVKVVLTVSNIIMPKFLIDELFGLRRPKIIISIVLTFLIINFIANFARNILDYHHHKNNNIIDLKVDQLLGEKIMNMDFECIEDPCVLEQLEKAKTGVSWYSGGISGLTQNIMNIISSFLTLLTTGFIIGMLSPWLVGIMFLVIFLNMFFNSIMEKKNTEFRKELVNINRKFGYFCNMVKDFSFGKDIRAYGADKMVSKKIDEYIEEDWLNESKRTRSQNKYIFLMIFSNVVQQAALYGYLGLEVNSKTFGIGDFCMLIGAANNFAECMNGLVREVISISRNADFMNEYRLFMLYPTKKDQGTRTIDLCKKHVIEFKNVSFSYPRTDKMVLKNVNITINCNKKFSMVGKNGAGKTTFIKLLTRLYEPTKGEITLDGINIKEYLLDEYMKLFSVVFQDYNLLAFKLGENVSAGQEYEHEKVENSLEKAGFGEKLTELENGIDTSVYKYFDDKGTDFSGGEAQKIAIARAFYKDSPYAILDEPTSALDPVAEYEIYTRFDKFIGDKTAIYISHRLSSCRFCDKIIVFDNGEIVEYGSHDELELNDGVYSKMWNAQAKYYV